jgi:RHS repeat-associated protein
MRTLYDGLGFEVIREGETFNDGSFTTRYSEGIQRQNNTGTEGSRYRWISEGAENIRTRSLYEDGYGATPGRFTGISVTLYGRGEAIAVSASTGSRGGAAYLGKDILGSVRSTTNEYGSLEDRYEYDAFGKPYKGDLTTGMNLGYTGKPYDTATGLYNYGFRDYQPEIARFTTIDPIRDGSNWFAYVNNDPVNYIDPFGLFDVAQFATATLQTVGGIFEIAGGITIAGGSGGLAAPVGIYAIVDGIYNVGDGIIGMVTAVVDKKYDGMIPEVVKAVAAKKGASEETQKLAGAIAGFVDATTDLAITSGLAKGAKGASDAIGAVQALQAANNVRNALPSPNIVAGKKGQ